MNQLHITSLEMNRHYTMIDSGFKVDFIIWHLITCCWRNLRDNPPAVSNRLYVFGCLLCRFWQSNAKHLHSINNLNCCKTASAWLTIGTINPLNAELNPICYLLALLGAHHFFHVNRIRVKLLTLRRLMSYIYGAPILDVSRSHTTTQHSR